MIEDHDQVFMLGHGTPSGLLSVGQFPGHYGHIIDDTFAEVLAEKDNNVFVWCNADGYVRWNELQGFYTGMFISEMSEARTMGMPFVTYTDVIESNQAFANIMRDTGGDYFETKQLYGEVAFHNPVAKYNHERLYVA